VDTREALALVKSYYHVAYGSSNIDVISPFDDISDASSQRVEPVLGDIIVQGGDDLIILGNVMDASFPRGRSFVGDVANASSQLGGPSLDDILDASLQRGGSSLEAVREDISAKEAVIISYLETAGSETDSEELGFDPREQSSWKPSGAGHPASQALIQKVCEQTDTRL
jgi:hypothetical protein